MMQINLPDVLAELHAAFERYERALVANDVETLNDLFWDSPLTLRYGIADVQYSYAEICKYRRERVVRDPKRALRNSRITTFGRDFGVADTEFVRDGSSRIGRQSQTWVKTAGGWKIVAAHVSFPDG